MDSIAVFQHLEDRPRRLVLRRLLHDRLVQVGVERLALRFDSREAVPAEHVEHLRLHHRHALHQRTGFARLFGRRDGAIEVVQDAENVERQRRLGVAQGGGVVTLGALLIVLELRLGPPGQVQVLVAGLFGFG